MTSAADLAWKASPIRSTSTLRLQERLASCAVSRHVGGPFPPKLPSNEDAFEAPPTGLGHAAWNRPRLCEALLCCGVASPHWRPRLRRQPRPRPKQPRISAACCATEAASSPGRFASGEQLWVAGERRCCEASPSADTVSAAVTRLAVSLALGAPLAEPSWLKVPRVSTPRPRLARGVGGGLWPGRGAPCRVQLSSHAKTGHISARAPIPRKKLDEQRCNQRNDRCDDHNGHLILSGQQYTRSSRERQLMCSISAPKTLLDALLLCTFHSFTDQWKLTILAPATCKCRTSL